MNICKYVIGAIIIQLKAIIFDRDGTLNVSSKASHGYTLTCDEMVLLSGVSEALLLLRHNNITPFVFTQQSCIGKGLLGEKTLADIHYRMQELLGVNAQIEKFYYCPHVEVDNCNCRKPKAGMLEQFILDTSYTKEEVLVVGDMVRDYKAACSAGIEFRYVRNPLHLDSDIYSQGSVPIYNNVLELVKALI